MVAILFMAGFNGAAFIVVMRNSQYSRLIQV